MTFLHVWEIPFYTTQVWRTFGSEEKRRNFNSVVFNLNQVHVLVNGGALDWVRDYILISVKPKVLMLEISSFGI